MPEKQGGNNAKSRGAGLSQWVDDFQACWLEMSSIVRGENMAVKKGCCRNQGIFARHRTIFTLEFGKQLLPSNQHRFRQFLRRRNKFSPCFRQPDAKTGAMRCRRPIKSKLQLGEGNDTQKNLRLIFTHPGCQLCRDLLSFEQRQQVRVHQQTHLKGNLCRDGGRIGFGQRAN
jgi:hypothetical protein